MKLPKIGKNIWFGNIINNYLSIKSLGECLGFSVFVAKITQNHKKY